jgi:hypothetical protein
MGYTHYYTRFECTHNKQLWSKFIEQVNILYNHLPDHSNSSGGHYTDHPLIVTGDDGTYCPPIADNTQIRFNGAFSTGDDFQKNDLGHETFHIARSVTKGEDYGKWGKKTAEHFECCKTARKPYDLLVQGVLILYRYYFHVKVSTDGDEPDWLSAQQWVTDTCGITLDFSKIMK